MRIRAGEARGASRQQVPVIVLEIREGGLEDPGVRDHDNIDAIEPSRVLAVPEHLSNQPFRAIPADGIPQLLRGDDAEPGCVGRGCGGAGCAARAGRCRLARRDEQREELPSNALPLIENPLEFTAPPEPPVLAETPGRRGGHVCWTGASLRRGNREALAAFGAAPLEHLTPILGAHAHEEPVGLRAPPTVWLERTLHGVKSPATATKGRRNLDTTGTHASGSRFRDLRGKYSSFPRVRRDASAVC
jgi:hypothetical protein